MFKAHRFMILFTLTLAAACGGPDEGALDDQATSDDELLAQPIVPAPLPADLTVGSFVVTAPPVLHCGSQSLSFTAIERNLGAGPAGRHYLHLQRQNPFNGAWIGAAAIQLGPIGGGVTRPIGGSFNFWNGPCDCLPTNYTINFRLFDDGGNLINETNETNNASNAVTVQAACP